MNLPSPSETQSELASPAGSVAKVLKTRRNGKLSSCEPCRLDKLKCDHQTPYCSRCLKQNRTSKCFYHPAPMTNPELRKQRITKPKPKPKPKAPASPSSTALTSSTEKRLLGRLFTHGNKGFLGPTSFSAIYMENNHSLETSFIESVDGLPQLPALQEKVEQGAAILSCLPDVMQLWDSILGGRFGAYFGHLPEEVFNIWKDTMPSCLTAKGEGGEGATEGFKDVSWAIWQSTVQPIAVRPEMRLVEWARKMSGKDLRWEVVGLILTMVGLLAHELDNWDAVFEEQPHLYVERNVFVQRLRAAASGCLTFCLECEALNEIYTLFMIKHIALVEVIQGDIHYTSWQKTGELCDAIVAMGLHRQTKWAGKLPFWLDQLRRKVFCIAFSRDKEAAIALGRPPRLLMKYCCVDPPLDISNDALLLEPAELQVVLAALTPDGWNTGARIEVATRQRVRLQLNTIQEDILDLALCSNTLIDIASEAKRVQASIDNFRSSYLTYIWPEPKNLNSLTGMTAATSSTDKSGYSKSIRAMSAISNLTMHASFVNIEFQFAKALINRQFKEREELVPYAKRLMDLVLLGISNSAIYTDLRCDYSCLLITYGLPSAGVLAIELLKKPTLTIAPSSGLTRSEIVQNLSIFINALGSIETHQGNYSDCSKGRNILKRILDQALNAGSCEHSIGALAGAGQGNSGNTVGEGVIGGYAAGGATTNGMGMGSGSGEVQMFMFPTENDVDFLEWLEMGDWINEVV